MVAVAALRPFRRPAKRRGVGTDLSRKRNHFHKATDAQAPIPDPKNPNKHPVKPAIEVLCTHAAKTLPDSLGDRRDVLAALARALHTDHPAHRDAQAQLAAIDAVETLERQLQTRFESPENKSHHRPGRRREGKTLR